MAITGKFAADFADFYAAVDKADAKLAGFMAGAGRVETALNRAVDAFSGRKIIQEATIAAEAVERLGGLSKLTRGELEQLGNQAQEATDKMRAMGVVVPSNVQHLANFSDRARQARVETAGLGESLRSGERVLAAFGVQIGPEVRALDALADSSGKTVTQLGGLATAGLVVGAGIAGWKIGRAAAEFLDLDEKIGDATAKLLGFGDVAGQKAAVQADALARASKIAGFEVKEMGLALMINADAAKVAIEANTKLSDQMARTEGPEKSRKLLEGYNAELQLLKSSGLLESLTKDINSHAFSLGELAERYRISTQAMSLFATEAANVARIEKTNADKLADLRLAFIKAEADAEDLKRKAAEDAKRKLSDEIHAAASAQQAAHDLGVAFDDAQRMARARTEEATAALREQEYAALRVQRAITSIDYDLSTDSGRRRFRELNPSAELSQAATPEYFQTHTIEDAIREGLLDLYAGYKGSGFGLVQPQGIVGGILPPSGLAPSNLTRTTKEDLTRTVRPLAPPYQGDGWGGSIALNVAVSINGVWDEATGRRAGDMIGNQIMTKLKFARQLGAA